MATVELQSLSLPTKEEPTITHVATSVKSVSISVDAKQETPNYKNHNHIGHRRQPSLDYTFVKMMHRGANVRNYGAVLQFVETLCKLNPIPEDKVEKLLKLFPKVKGYESLYGSQRFSTQIVSNRGQEVLEAGAFLVLTSGGQYVDKILPYYLSYLEVLPRLKLLDDEIRRSATNFTHILVAQLAEMATMFKDKREEIVTHIFHFYNNVETQSPCLLQGVLSGLGKSRVPLPGDQIDALVRSFGPLLNDPSEESIKMKVLVFKVMKQLTTLAACKTEWIEYFNKSALNFLEQKKNYQVIEKDTFSCAIDLIVSCATVHLPLMAATTEFLQQYFAAYFEVLEGSFSPAAIEEYNITLEGLSRIVQKSPSKASSIVDFIVDTLLNSTNSYEWVQYSSLRDTAVDALCKILKAQMNNDQHADLSLVNSVFTTLYTPFYLAHKKYVKQLGQVQGSRITYETLTRTGGASISPGTKAKTRTTAEETFSDSKPNVDKYKQNENLLSNIIIIIGKITRSLNDSRVTDLILLRLLGRIHYPPQNIDVLIIEQLNELCLLGQESAYNAIIVEFMNIFKRILKDTETRNITNTAMPNALLHLATNLSLEFKGIRDNLRKRVQKLFCQLGKDISSHDNRTYSSPLIQGMGYLLPIIAELCKGQTKSSILDTDPESDSAKLYRSVWFYCVLFRFVDRQAWRSDWFECTKRIAAQTPVLTSKKLYYFKQMQMELEGLLQNGFSEKDFGQHQKTLMELLPGNVPNIKNLTSAEVLYVMSIYHLEALRANTGNFEPVFAYLEDQAISLNEHLAECCKSVSEKAFAEFMEYLKSNSNKEDREKILELETQVLMVKYASRSSKAREVADKAIVSTAEAYPHITFNKTCLKTLLDLVETIGKACDTPLVGIVQLPNTEFNIELPDDVKDRITLLKYLVDLSTTYIRYGIASAPEQTNMILQEYLNSFRQLSLGFLNHIGFSLAVEISSIQIPKAAPVVSKKDKTALPAIPGCVTSPAAKFVNTLDLKSLYIGEIEGIIDFIGDNKQQSLSKVSTMLLNKFKTAIEHTSQHKHIEMKEFNNTVYRAVAFLVTQPQQTYPELIHMICWAPVIIFTEESLQTAVGAWTWLLAARPDLSVEIMSEISDSWSWSVDQRIGLFSDAERDPNPLSVAKPRVRLDHHRRKYADAPHKHWINFLSERFIIVRETSSKELNVLINMLNKALSRPEGLSVLPASISTRYRLLLLCLRVIHSGALNDISEMLLRERVYLAAISWFCHEATWYDPGRRDALVEDVKVILEFCKALVAEDTYEKKKKEKSQLTFYDYHGDNKSQEIILTYDLQKTRKLLILLLGNEIDHIIAWTNPQNRIALQIPEEHRFSTAKVANWKDFISTAWDISPRVCVHMSKRFPNSKHLRRFLERKVRESAQAVLDVPEAVTFLVTENNVQMNVPELKYLLYWANATPPVALGFLHKNYNGHPMVTQYAVRALKSFPPETIIFYIPQLVQALRYDKSGLVLAYLVAAAKESEVVAHQLIWNTMTYTEGEESDLTKPAKELSERIISNFSDEVKNRYQEEFTFFENVTKISGILKEQAETKEERKALLKSELGKLDLVPGNLYLPTNPESRVHAIVPSNSTPLQSAAKVPILVAFECHTKEEERTEVDEEGKSKIVWQKSFVQGCIFKVGDDVRQDMLALQIIELFKRAFKHVDLDIFVFPYKVIATKPGCGLIEVVPNAKSRDALGKEVEGGLVEYFQSKYGPPSSEAYLKARSNFIKSMAAYSVVSYILQIKDRHNGNILVDNEGHLVHIDFGFIFESSPGGDMGFETSPFKMNSEMITIMGGRPDAEPFKWFMESGVKAFLAARQYTDSIMTLVGFMLDTKLPCFKGDNVGTMEHLKQRLCPDKTDRAAAEFFTKKMVDALSNFHIFTTYFYDMFQHFTQGIDY